MMAYYKQVSLVLLSILHMAGVVVGNNEQPANLTYTITTKRCVTEVKLKWTEPSTNLRIQNYIIAYHATQPYNGSIDTLTSRNNKTVHLISVSATIKSIIVQVSSNFSNENDTYRIGQVSKDLAVDTTNTVCNSTTIESQATKTGVIYVLKLAGIIFGGAVGILLFVFVIFRLCVWRLEKRYDQRDLHWNAGKDNPLRELDHQLPISAENLYDHVSLMKFHDNKGFKKEFSKLVDTSVQGCSFGNRPYNATKNRYANVLTFDKSRVALEAKSHDVSSSYINANYVDGFNRPKAYIATQAPLPDTIADFWRMIWEQESNIIVTIVNLKEKDGTTCAKYWPDASTVSYGKITIKHLETIGYADYVIRVMEIQHVGSTELRIVRQFSFTSWPTQRTVPLHPTSFLEFVKKVASFKANNNQPVVVHCSSGNGRTGVYIMVDIQLNRLMSESRNINVFYDLDCSRQQRFQLIRHLEEYIFVHDCILDHVIYEKRLEINGRNLTDYIAKRKDRGPKDELGFSAEFETIMKDITAMKIRADVAKLPKNSLKNRFLNILPFDHTRVKLKDKSIAEGSDYINANYVDGLTRKRQFIITQSPMEETLYEFCCMLWETGCLTVVMLSFGDKETVVYWPEKDEVVKAGKLKVRLISREKQGFFEIRNLEIVHSEHTDTRLVRQYHYETWPENSNDASLFDFVNFAVQCVQWNTTAKSRTIVVHCRAGTGKSGVFVALCQLMEKLNCEGAVNIVQTVRRLRQCRMAAIQTLSQYELLYHAIAIYYKTHYLTRNERDAEIDLEDEQSASTSSYMISSAAFESDEMFDD
ncbi:receptor-type tyrosine-protein phosphatase S-like [Rhopilema esculentum]|uniref:receptor-type tyrosine-protein phosphatase S-like n=1 Tax=Rhopilema esculentum TaxID=499914 RepID=UPI0031E16A08